MSYWKQEALRWLKDAIEDFNVAKDLLRSNHHSASCFHSQQAAEKAVKAALYKNRIEAKGAFNPHAYQKAGGFRKHKA